MRPLLVSALLAIFLLGVCHAIQDLRGGSSGGSISLNEQHNYLQHWRWEIPSEGREAKSAADTMNSHDVPLSKMSGHDGPSSVNVASTGSAQRHVGPALTSVQPMVGETWTGYRGQRHLLSLSEGEEEEGEDARKEGEMDTSATSARRIMREERKGETPGEVDTSATTLRRIMQEEGESSLPSAVDTSLATSRRVMQEDTASSKPSSGTRRVLEASMAQEVERRTNDKLEAAPSRKQVSPGRELASQSVQWSSVRVSTLSGPSQFGWVITRGEASRKAKAYTQQCFSIETVTHGGQRMDKGADQKAALVGYLSKGNIMAAADITYNPVMSHHVVCYNPPTAGDYNLDIRVSFLNAASLINTLNPNNSAGFANYSKVREMKIQVSAPPGFSLTLHRASLPICTTQELANSRNLGFWQGKQWYPYACQLRRLSQAEILGCFNGKRILMLGDSETRITYGILSTYLKHSSRQEFLALYQKNRYFEGDMVLEMLTQQGVPRATSPQGPPINNKTGEAMKIQYEFMEGVNATFYGSIYEGFVSSRIRTTLANYQTARGVQNQMVDFHLTYSSLFTIGGEVFSPWKLSGKLTDGAVVDQGGAKTGPNDIVFVANQLHDIRNYESPVSYVQALKDSFLPKLRPLLKSPSSVTMLGGLSSIEHLKLRDLYASGNPRIAAFENLSLTAFHSAGYPNFLRIAPLTAPRPDLAYDSTHYTWPVTLAILDLWLGSQCPVAAVAT